MSKTVLIVEDDPRNQRLFRDFLEKFAFTVYEAGNGKEAVDKAQQFLPDLVLMDIQMPVMNGIDATRLIKSDPATSKIPVIALTSYAMKDDELKIRTSGCDDYLTKPVDLRLLIRKVKEYTEKRAEATVK